MDGVEVAVELRALVGNQDEFALTDEFVEFLPFAARPVPLPEESVTSELLPKAFLSLRKGRSGVTENVVAVFMPSEHAARRIRMVDARHVRLSSPRRVVGERGTTGTKEVKVLVAKLGLLYPPEGARDR